MNNVTSINDWELNFSFSPDLRENSFKEVMIENVFTNGCANNLS